MISFPLFFLNGSISPDLLLLAKQNGGLSLDVAGSEDPGIEDLFADPRARYDFSALFHVSNLPPSQLAEKLWQAVGSDNTASE